MRSKKALKNIISSVILQIVSIICGLILPRTIIKAYGSSVNGLISSIAQFLGYITLLEAGIGPVVKSILYKPIAEKNKEQIEKILKSAKKFFNVISYIFIIYLMVLCLIIPSLVKSEFSVWYTISLILIISISTFAEYFFGMVYKLYLQAEQKTYITANIQIVATILNTFFCVILINYGVSIQIVKLITAIIFVMRPLLQNIYVKKKYNISLRKNIEEFELKKKWDGLAQHIAAVIHNNTDIVILTIFSNMIEVSVYTVYLFVIRGIKNLVQSFTGGVDASFGNMYAKGEKEKLNSSFKTYEFFYFTIITITFSSALGLILPFIQIYTKGIKDAEYYRPLFAYLILISEFIWAIRLPYSSLTLAVGHFKETRKGAWIEAITNIIISIILVKKYGIVGVAIGTLCSMTIRTIEFMNHSAKKILERKNLFSIMHVIVIIVETIIITVGIYQIIKNIQFVTYLQWAKYAFISGVYSTFVTVIINSCVFRKQCVSILKMLRNILLKKKECK